MKRLRLHVVAWASLLIALGLVFWPLDPNVSLMDMAGAMGGAREAFASGPVTALDALFSAGDLGGTALSRLSLALVLVGLTVGIEVALRYRSPVHETTRPSMADLTKYNGP